MLLLASGIAELISPIKIKLKPGLISAVLKHHNIPFTRCGVSQEAYNSLRDGKYVSESVLYKLEKKCNFTRNYEIKIDSIKDVRKRPIREVKFDNSESIIFDDNTVGSDYLEANQWTKPRTFLWDLRIEDLPDYLNDFKVLWKNEINYDELKFNTETDYEKNVSFIKKHLSEINEITSSLKKENPNLSSSNLMDVIDEGTSVSDVDKLKAIQNTLGNLGVSLKYGISIKYKNDGFLEDSQLLDFVDYADLVKEDSSLWDKADKSYRSMIKSGPEYFELGKTLYLEKHIKMDNLFPSKTKLIKEEITLLILITSKDDLAHFSHEINIPETFNKFSKGAMSPYQFNLFSEKYKPKGITRNNIIFSLPRLEIFCEEDKSFFKNYDLEKMEYQLENTLLPADYESRGFEEFFNFNYDDIQRFTTEINIQYMSLLFFEGSMLGSELFRVAEQQHETVYHWFSSRSGTYAGFRSQFQFVIHKLQHLLRVNKEDMEKYNKALAGYLNDIKVLDILDLPTEPMFNPFKKIKSFMKNL